MATVRMSEEEAIRRGIIKPADGVQNSGQAPPLSPDPWLWRSIKAIFWFLFGLWVGFMIGR